MKISLLLAGTLLWTQMDSCMGRKSSESSYPYAPAVVMLHGMLGKEHHFGPPSYGKDPNHDIRVEVPVLTLDQSIRTEPRPHVDPEKDPNVDPIPHVNRIRLYFHDADQAKVKELMGKRIVVEGILNEYIAPMDFMDVTMRASSIRLEE